MTVYASTDALFDLSVQTITVSDVATQLSESDGGCGATCPNSCVSSTG